VRLAPKRGRSRSRSRSSATAWQHHRAYDHGHLAGPWSRIS
jgi:hypothetical protein